MNTHLPAVALVQFLLALSPLLVIGANPAPASVKKTEKAAVTLESASALADKKKYEEALDICDALIAKKRMNSLDALKMKIRIYERATWWPEALPHYERLLKTATSTAARNEVRVAMARIKALELSGPTRHWPW